ITFGEYLSALLSSSFACIKILSRFARNDTRDHKHMRAQMIEPTRDRHIRTRNNQVSNRNRSITFDISSGFLKTEPVRNVKKIPSSVRIICALESAFLYQSTTLSKTRRAYSKASVSSGSGFNKNLSSRVCLHTFN